MSDRCGQPTETTGEPCRNGPNCPHHNQRGPGRPYIELTDEQVELIERLAGLGLTQEEISHCIPIAETTLRKRIREGDQGIDVAYARGRARWKENARRRHRDIAMGNAERLGVDSVPISEQRKVLEWIDKTQFGAAETHRLEHAGGVTHELDLPRENVRRALLALAGAEEGAADVPTGNGRRTVGVGQVDTGGRDPEGGRL